MTSFVWPHGFNSVTADLTPLPALPSGWDWYGAVSFGDELLAFGTSLTQFVSARLTSAAGSWTLGTPSANADLVAGYLDKAARVGGVYASYISDTNVATSSDGLVWTVAAHGLPALVYGYYGIGAALGAFYITGFNYTGGAFYETIHSSTDATSWTLQDTVATTPTQWQPSNAPVELEGAVYIPHSTIGSGPFTQEPYCKYDVTNGLTQQPHLAAGVPFKDSNGGQPTVIDNGILLTATTPGNTSALAIITGFGETPKYVGNLYNIGGTQTAAGFAAGSGASILLQHSGDADANVYPDATLLDVPSGKVFSLHSVPDATALALYNDNAGTLDNDFVGPLDGASVLFFLAGDTAPAGMYTAQSAVPTPSPDIAVTTFPTTYTDITLTSQYDSSQYADFVASALGEEVYRVGAAVFVITPPPGALAITLTFPLATHPDVYIDIFAQQNSTFSALMENYAADYYGYMYEPQTYPARAVHTIPVSGVAPLTVVLQAYDATPDNGGFDVTISDVQFWTDFINSEAS